MQELPNKSERLSLNEKLNEQLHQPNFKVTFNRWETNNAALRKRPGFTAGRVPNCSCRSKKIGIQKPLYKKQTRF